MVAKTNRTVPGYKQGEQISHVFLGLCQHLSTEFVSLTGVHTLDKDSLSRYRSAISHDRRQCV